MCFCFNSDTEARNGSSTLVVRKRSIFVKRVQKSSNSGRISKKLATPALAISKKTPKSALKASSISKHYNGHEQVKNWADLLQNGSVTQYIKNEVMKEYNISSKKKAKKAMELDDDNDDYNNDNDDDETEYDYSDPEDTDSSDEDSIIADIISDGLLFTMERYTHNARNLSHKKTAG